MGNTRITAETEVSTSELACVLGITGRYVRQLTEDGVLEKASKGKFLLCDSVQKYLVSQAREGEKSADEMKLEKARRAADVTLKSSKAKIAKMEVDELQGKMHRSEDVAAMTEDLVYTIRGALMSLPGRLAVDTTTASSPAEAAEIIQKEISFVMNSIADYRYDPKKYEERVRARRDWGIYGEGDTGDDE